MPNLLLIDDEFLPMSYYVKVLKIKGYSVQFQHSVDETLDWIKDHQQKFDLVILDMMMPPGSTFRGRETLEGLRTGVHLFHSLRSKWGGPVIVLTNVSELSNLDLPLRDRNLRVVRKAECPPLVLEQLVKEMLNKKGVAVS